MAACEQPPSAAIPPDLQDDPCLSQPSAPPAPDSDWVYNPGTFTSSYYLRQGRSAQWATEVKRLDDAGEFDFADAETIADAAGCGVAGKIPLPGASAGPAACGVIVGVDEYHRHQELGAAKKILADGGCLQLKMAGGKYDDPTIVIKVTVSNNQKYCLS